MKLSYYIAIAFEIFIDIAVASALILYFLDKRNNLRTMYYKSLKPLINKNINYRKIFRKVNIIKN